MKIQIKWFNIETFNNTNIDINNNIINIYKYIENIILVFNILEINDIFKLNDKFTELELNKTGIINSKDILEIWNSSYYKILFNNYKYYIAPILIDHYNNIIIISIIFINIENYKYFNIIYKYNYICLINNFNKNTKTNILINNKINFIKLILQNNKFININLDNLELQYILENIMNYIPYFYINIL